MIISHLIDRKIWKKNEPRFRRTTWTDGNGNAQSQIVDRENGDRVVEMRTCRRPDPRLTKISKLGRPIESHQIIIYDPSATPPCELSEDTVQAGVNGRLVPKGDCDTQRELGACPLEQMSKFFKE